MEGAGSMSGSPSPSFAAAAAADNDDACGAAGGGGEEEIGGDPADLEDARDPSSSRRSRSEVVWPGHFVEAVAARLAIDAAQTEGRLAAAPAVATLFQVCSTWRSISRSEMLWEEVTRGVWPRHRPLLPSWHEEFRRLHRTALNFRVRRCTHRHVLPPTEDTVICRRLALSDLHLAAGFSDGAVRLLHLPAGEHLATFGPHPEQARLGLYSQSISGIALLSNGIGDRLVFAFQDGDVHVASLDGPRLAGPAVRRVCVGNPVNDGTMVDFTGGGGSRWWAGLFAGVPGRSWHVWDGETGQLAYVGGSLTDADSVMGWRMLTDLGSPALGRVRMAEPGVAVGCTGSRIQAVDLDGDNGGGAMGSTVSYSEFQWRAIVDTVDACNGRVVVVDQRRTAAVRKARTLEVACRFSTARRGELAQQQGGGGTVVGCMNWGYAVVCCGGGAGGEIRVWDAASGGFLYTLRERIGGGDDDGNGGGGSTSVVVASDRYVSAWSADTGLHLWDFGA